MLFVHKRLLFYGLQYTRQRRQNKNCRYSRRHPQDQEEASAKRGGLRQGCYTVAGTAVPSPVVVNGTRGTVRGRSGERRAAAKSSQ